MFEEVFERLSIGRSITVGGYVVDAYKDFTIPVKAAPPPPPEEGKAEIVLVVAPSEFTPGESFPIGVNVRNSGGNDELFVRIKDIETGQYLGERILLVPSGTATVFPFNITLTKTTDFRGRAEAGHVV